MKLLHSIRPEIVPLPDSIKLCLVGVVRSARPLEFKVTDRIIYYRDRGRTERSWSELCRMNDSNMNYWQELARNQGLTAADFDPSWVVQRD